MDIAQSRPKIAARQTLTGRSKANLFPVEIRGKNIHKNAANASHFCHQEGLALG